MRLLEPTVKNKIEKLLPDGTTLVVETWDEPDYPGIRITLVRPDGSDKCICFAEYNTVKSSGNQLLISAYAHDIDERYTMRVTTPPVRQAPMYKHLPDGDLKIDMQLVRDRGKEPLKE